MKRPRHSPPSAVILLRYDMTSEVCSMDCRFPSRIISQKELGGNGSLYVNRTGQKYRYETPISLNIR